MVMIFQILKLFTEGFEQIYLYRLINLFSICGLRYNKTETGL